MIFNEWTKRLEDWANGLEGDIDDMQRQIDRHRKADGAAFGVIADRLAELEKWRKSVGTVATTTKEVADDIAFGVIADRLAELERWRKSMSPVAPITEEAAKEKIWPASCKSTACPMLPPELLATIISRLRQVPSSDRQRLGLESLLDAVLQFAKDHRDET